MNRENIHDAVLLVLASFALCAEVGVLLYQMKLWKMPTQWSRAIDPVNEIGQVITRKRSLKVRAASSLTWYPLAEGDRIQALDTVMTGADSSARLILHDRGEMFLESYTLIHFSDRPEQKKTILAFELNEGTIRIRTKDPLQLTVRSRHLDLKSDTELVVAAGSVAVPPEILVTSGTVEVQAKQGAEAVVMKAGEAFSLSSDRGIAKADTKLNYIPKSPRDGEVVSLNEAGEVGFRWEGDPAEVLEWDSDPSFSSPGYVSAQNKTASLELPPGKYYWRLRRAVAVGAPNSFTVLPGIQYAFEEDTPPTAFPSNRPVELHWKAIPDASLYEFELSQDPSLSKKVTRDMLSTSSKRLGKLKPGKYYWRIRAKHRDLGPWPSSAIFNFVVKNTLAPPKPKSVRILPAGQKDEALPPEKESEPSGWLHSIYDWWIPSAHAEKVVRVPGPTLWMEFAWESAAGASRYRLQISATKKFKELLAQIDTEYTTSATELPDRSEYFWRVASIDEHGMVGPFSRVYRTLRQKAKPRPAPRREIAEARAASPSLAPIVPEAPAIIDTVVTPPYLPWHIYRMGVGYGGSYWRHQATAPSFHTASSGFPPHRISLQIQGGVGLVDSELLASYARLQLVSQDGALRGIQTTGNFDMWSVEIAMRHWALGPWGTFLRVRNEVDYRRSGPETLALRTQPFAGVGISWRGQWSVAYPKDLTADLGLELGPLGLRRGFAAPLRVRWDVLRTIDGLELGTELNAYPYVRKSGDEVNETNVELGAALVLRWEVASREELARAAKREKASTEGTEEPAKPQKH